MTRVGGIEGNIEPVGCIGPAISPFETSESISSACLQIGTNPTDWRAVVACGLRSGRGKCRGTAGSERGESNCIFTDGVTGNRETLERAISTRAIDLVTIPRASARATRPRGRNSAE